MKTGKDIAKERGPRNNKRRVAFECMLHIEKGEAVESGSKGALTTDVKYLCHFTTMMTRS